MTKDRTTEGSNVKTRRILTLYEPRRRWWGGMRADLELSEYTSSDDWGWIVITTVLGRGTWNAPTGWIFQRVELDA